MNAQHEEKNSKQQLRWSRWGGPGLALLLLAGAGVYTLAVRLAPVKPAAEQGAQAAAARGPGSSTSAAVGGVRAQQRPASAATPGAAGAPAVGTSAPAVAQTEAEQQAQAQELAQRRDAVREAAHKYRLGRFNAFFREEPFLKEFAAGGPAQLAALKAELADPSVLSSLPADTQYLTTKPEAALDRMSMIDLLHTMAPKDPAARDTMVELLMEPIDSSLPDVAKKGLVGEKYDILFRLAQLDRQLALDSYAQLDSPKMKSLLREALMAGLAESGATMDEVKRLMGHL